MAELFTVSGIMTLLMLVLLQAVLGFDNLLYISIESKRVPEDKQAMVRKFGIGLAIVLRIILLYVVTTAINYFKTPFFNLNIEGVFTGEFTGHSLIVLIGGAFILYTALKEISHMLSIDDLGHHDDANKRRTVASAITWIVIMNLVFSFDSILSAMALTENFWIMAVAIIISGALMIFLADHVSEFLKKNRMYEVLGLFILFIVGVMLVSEGGHLAHISLFTYKVEAMAKSTFYFVLVVLVLVDLCQTRYQKKLASERAKQSHSPA